MSPDPALDRRAFLVSSGAATAAAWLGSSPLRASEVRGSDELRVGLIGCGGRGTGAAANCLDAAPGLKLVALGDLFADRVSRARGQLAGKGENAQVPDERCFSGFDAYQKVIDAGVDLVILATPPHFRPIHLEAAVAAGKHVFMEKPVATDPAGIRRVLAASELAQKKGLGIVAGTQRRHEAGYLEIMKRVHDGAIGEPLAARCYWNMGGLWVHERQPGESDMEWQCRNWLYFTWLSGDHIVEQHIHNIDVVIWAMKRPPVACMGMGGRQVRTDAKFGNIFDHFAIDYDFGDGVHALSMCRQTDGAHGMVEESVIGTAGEIGTTSGRYQIRAAKGKWERLNGGNDAYVQEHTDLIASIRAGKPLNEGRMVAESTLAAIMGRMSAYTGQRITWEQAMTSALDLSPKSYELGPLPMDPVATPGLTKLI